MGTAAQTMSEPFGAVFAWPDTLILSSATNTVILFPTFANMPVILENRQYLTGGQFI